MKITKLNEFKVKPIKIKKDDRVSYGHDLFPQVYHSTFLCAKTKSGKTTALLRMLENCAGKKTKFIVFCSTIYKDALWRTFMKMVKSKNKKIEKLNEKRLLEEKEPIPLIEFHAFTSLYDYDERGREQNILNQLVKKLEEDYIDDSDSDSDTDTDEEQEHDIIMTNDNRQNKKRKEKKELYQAPDYIIVLDDLSTELKSPALVSLLKKSRHNKLQVIISSQYYHDLLPAGRLQLDYILLWKNMNDEKLKIVHGDSNLPIDEETFIKLYHAITDGSYNFMYIDKNQGTIRKNFNELIEL